MVAFRDSVNLPIGITPLRSDDNNTVFACSVKIVNRLINLLTSLIQTLDLYEPP